MSNRESLSAVGAVLLPCRADLLPAVCAYRRAGRPCLPCASCLGRPACRCASERARSDGRRASERDREIDFEIERERSRQRERKLEIAAEIESEKERVRALQRAKDERQERARIDIQEAVAREVLAPRLCPPCLDFPRLFPLGPFVLVWVGELVRQATWCGQPPCALANSPGVFRCGRSRKG